MESNTAHLDQVWFTSTEAAKYLRLSRRESVMEAYREGRLKGHRTSPGRPGGRPGRVRFHRDDLDAYQRGGDPARRPIRLAS